MREKIVEEMLDLLAANADVQTIIDKAAEIMENPVILVDNRFHIMYTPTDMEIENDLWKRTLESEYVSDQLILAMKEAQVINTLQRSLEPVEQDIIPSGYLSFTGGSSAALSGFMIISGPWSPRMGRASM